MLDENFRRVVRLVMVCVIATILCILLGCTGPVRVETPAVDFCIPTDLYPCQPIIIKDPRDERRDINTRRTLNADS